jgi:hypothetical protein
MTIFKLDVVKDNLDTAEVEIDCEGNRIQRTFLGEVTNLYPSGKFYTPWANSNVEICLTCAKAQDLPCDETSPCSTLPDHHCEACKDAEWMNQAAWELASIGAFLESGEGDSCNLFASRLVGPKGVIDIVH